MSTRNPSHVSTETMLLIGGAAFAAWHFRAQLEKLIGIGPAAPAGDTTSSFAAGTAADPTVGNDPTTIAVQHAWTLASQGYSPTQQAQAAQQAATAATVQQIQTPAPGTPVTLTRTSIRPVDPASIPAPDYHPAPAPAPAPVPAPTVQTTWPSSWQDTPAGKAYINAPVVTASVQLPGMTAPQQVSITQAPPPEAYAAAGAIYGPCYALRAGDSIGNPTGAPTFMTFDQYRAWQIKALATGNYSC